MDTSIALGHIRICDLSGQLAGAGATRWFAAFGAQVIRVEDPVRKGRWDRLRGAAPHLDDSRDIETGGPFNNHNVEKLGITLDMRRAEGKELFCRLVEISDVVVENFAAGVLDRLGFPYERLRELKPDIIYASSSGFGHGDGPYHDFKTWGPIVQALCGLTSLSGLPDLPPAGLGFSYMDHHGANLLAVGILAALVHRDLTGEGQWVDMATTEAGATLLGPAFLDHSVNGPAGPRKESSNRASDIPMAPHNVYPTSDADRWVAIACRDDRDWSALAAMIGKPWAVDADLGTVAGRLSRRDELDGLIATWTATQSGPVIADAVVAAGVPAAVVASPCERIDKDPFSAEWQLWPVVDHPRRAGLEVDGLPVHLSRTDWVIQRGAPLLGQHNDKVYGELLGLSADTQERLRREGIM